jgi:hypothetical protein
MFRETYVTVSIAGPGGLLYSAYIMNLIGMALMLWSAVAARRARPTAPGLLAAGWAWTAATFWRATSDRFWWVSQGHALFAGPMKLWLGPALTVLAMLGLFGSLILVLNSPMRRR